MREIKFKFYCEDSDTLSRAFTIEELVNGTYDWHGDIHKSVKNQYTGLKDKNGVEIYESDIVRITTESNSWNSKVGNHGVWHEILVYDSDLDIDFISINYAYDCLDCEIEVIGNIYENIELSKDK